MKHTGFTPGPWRWAKRGDDTVLENDGPILGSILRIDRTAGLAPKEKDADLIARAPVLLAENKRLLALLEQVTAYFGDGNEGPLAVRVRTALTVKP